MKMRFMDSNGHNILAMDKVDAWVKENWEPMYEEYLIRYAELGNALA